MWWFDLGGSLSWFIGGGYSSKSHWQCTLADRRIAKGIEAMKALLLAAGFGTRLRPLTDNLPKCLVPIKGEALLGLWIEKLHKLGIKDILINTHYLSDLVEEYLRNKYPGFGVITCHEKKLLGTAKTFIENLNFFNETDCILIHADNYCEDDLNSLLDVHMKRPSGCLMTIASEYTENTFIM
jgi:mannose-1-phosphate guanylyltransferase